MAQLAKRWWVFDWGNTLITRGQAESMLGAHELLSALSPHVHIAVVNDTPLMSAGMLREVLDKAHLGTWINRVLTADELRLNKTDPAFITALCRVLHTTPAQVTWVGDDWTIDIAPARQVGVRSLWVNQDQDEADYNDLLSVYEALPDLEAVPNASEWAATQTSFLKD